MPGPPEEQPGLRLPSHGSSSWFVYIVQQRYVKFFLGLENSGNTTLVLWNTDAQLDCDINTVICFAIAKHSIQKQGHSLPNSEEEYARRDLEQKTDMRLYLFSDRIGRKGKEFSVEDYIKGKEENLVKLYCY